MADQPVFTEALDLVVGILEARKSAGFSAKAAGAGLHELCKAVNATDDVQRMHQPLPGLSVVPQRSVSVSVPITVAAEVQNRPETAAVTRNVYSFPSLPELAGEVEGGARLDMLSHEVSACVLCPKLAETRLHAVFGEGTLGAELMLVGEAPGPEEDREGKPFAGESGALLGKMLLAMGLSRENVFLTSALKCRPDVPSDEPGSRPPTGEELQRCLPYLAAQIAIVKPKVIVALGAGAMRALFGSTETVGKLRSRWHEIHGIPVMPTFHPSYLIRNSGNSEKRKVWEDLLQVLERLGRTVTDKQAGFFKSKTGA